MMRDAAIAWVCANCNTAMAQSDIIGWMDVAVSMRRNCVFAIGPGLTSKRCPYLLHWFAGELFIFELEPRQAAALGLRDDAVSHLIDVVEVVPGPEFPPLMSLERVEIQSPVVTRDTKTIVCRCDYRLLRSPMEIGALMRQMGIIPPGPAVAPGLPHPVTGHQPHQFQPGMHGPSVIGIHPHQMHGHGAFQPRPPQAPNLPYGFQQQSWNQVQPENSIFEHGLVYAFQMQLTIAGKSVTTFYAYPDQFLTASGTLILVFTPTADALVGALPVTAGFVSCISRIPPTSPIEKSMLSNPLAVLLEIDPTGHSTSDPAS